MTSWTNSSMPWYARRGLMFLPFQDVKGLAGRSFVVEDQDAGR